MTQPSATDDSPPPPQPAAPQPRPSRRGWSSRDILRAAGLVAGLYLSLRLLWFAHKVFLVAFLGVLMGLALSAGVDRLQRRRIPRGIGAAAIVIVFIGSLVGLGAWMGPTLREQSGELRTKLPDAIERIETWWSKKQSSFGLLVGREAPQAGAAKARPADPGATGARPAPPPLTPQTAGKEKGAADSSAASPKSGIGDQLGSVTRYLFPFLTSTVEAVAGLLLVLFLAIYTAADPELYRRGILHLFPHQARSRTGDVLSATAAVLRKWLVTQLIAMVTIGVVTTIVFLLLGVKAALVLGVLTGLFEFIPTIGPIIASVPAVAMGFLDSPEKALTVLIVYVVLHFLESHIMIPLLMKGGMDLPPALTIISQALMALLFGFLGLMIAVPLLAAILVPVKMLYVHDAIGDEMPVRHG
ncbi:MAG: AI-2E family transporter [Gemmatimonadota bacterium]|nr:AI-2E family transporter [Gemmatimonadota bacterium]